MEAGKAPRVSIIGERGFETSAPSGPETKKISHGVEFSIHVSGASTDKLT
jgi:hypothetical protein